MRRFSHRRVVVIFCFAVWLGAAALACGPFVSRPLADQPVVAAQTPVHNVPDASDARLAADIEH